MSMDYQMLLTQGEQEWEKTMEKLNQRLERMSPGAMIDLQVKIAQGTNEINKYVPLGIYVI